MKNLDVPVFELPDLQSGLNRHGLQHCLSTLGVFYLQAHGLHESLHERFNAVTMAFFEQSDQAGLAAMMPSDHRIRRGYSRLADESTATVTKTGTYSDYSMCYSMGIEKNLFPSPEFEVIWTHYFAQMNHLAWTVAKALLNTSTDLLEENVRSPGLCESLLRFRYFPDVPEDRCAESEPLRMAPHYDLSILTLIHQTPCRSGFVSLQAETVSGYVDLPPMPGMICVMCGAVATLMSAGQIRAPRHRVSAPRLIQREGSSRTSTVFFLRPSSNYEFSVPFARSCGFEPDLPSEKATFKQWISGNYVNLHTNQVPGS